MHVQTHKIMEVRYPGGASRSAGELGQGQDVAVRVAEPGHLGATGRGPHARLVLVHALVPDELHAAPGQVRGNNAIVSLGNGTGGLLVVNGSLGKVDVVVDVNGYFE